MSMTSKVVSLESAVSLIKDGSSLSFSGFGHSGHPLSFVRELIRHKPKNLTLNAIAECWPAEFLVGTDSVSEINMSNLMFEGLGRCRAISDAIEEGRVGVDDHSHLALSLRLLAAGWGVPFLPITSMGGTDLENIQTGKKRKYSRITSPFDNEEVGAVSALQSDVAIIHTNKSDSQGNAIIYGAASVVEAQIRGAKTVIVTTERLVSSEEIIEENQNVIIPGILVSAVAHTPFGSHPGGMYKVYDEDNDHMNLYYEASRNKKELAAYHAQYIYGMEDENQYYENLGAKRLMNLRVDPTLQFAIREWK